MSPLTGPSGHLSPTFGRGEESPIAEAATPRPHGVGERWRAKRAGEGSLPPPRKTDRRLRKLAIASASILALAAAAWAGLESLDRAYPPPLPAKKRQTVPASSLLSSTAVMFTVSGVPSESYATKLV